MPIKNDCLLQVLRGNTCNRIPIWIMRQAGRYLPEYKKLRQKTGDFLKLCKTPELACQTTLMPINRFDLDAAIIFSDILVIPESMGMPLKFEENKGPVFEHPIKNEKDFDNLISPPLEENLSFTFEAIKLTKIELNDRIPLIGFCGSPWTIACYMIEGGTSKNFEKTFKMMYEQPNLLLKILDKLTAILTEYLELQLKHGADILMIFDTWGGILPYSKYQEFSLDFNQKIITSLNQLNTPNIFFSKGAFNHIDKIVKAAPSCIGIDWMSSLKDAQKVIGNKIAIQGNLDPSILLASKTVVKQETEKMLNQINTETRHIVNLGHGITPDATPDNVETLIATVRRYK